MVESESGWHFAGYSRVTDAGKINLPERLFNEGLMYSDRVTYWSFEVGVGFVLISSQPLEKEIYKNQSNSDVGDPPSYRTNIPKQFFSDYKGRGRGDHEQPVPEKARMEYGERRFFAFRTEMAEGATKSCYVFDQEQFDSTIGDDSWADPLDEIPRFS